MTPRGTTPAMSPDGPGQQRFGHFVLVRKLGSGSMGEVWLARNTRRAGRAKHVAIKRIAEQMSQDSVFHERFRTEAAVVQICRDHPNIVRILDYSTVDDRLFLEMEYVEGTDLGAHLEEAGHLEPDEAVRIIEQAAAGLGEVHDRKIEHRDVKPANLLLRRVDRDTEPDDPRWRVVVTDFGIVSTGEGGLTLPNKFMGTPFYAAPEQWPQGPARGPVGAMDVYALGAVLYHLLAGQLPYPDDPADSRSPEESQFASRRAGSPPSPSTFRPDVAPAFDAVLSRAMAWQPQDRFRSTKEFAEAARAALEGRTAAAPASEEEVIQAGPVVPERRRLRVVLIGLAATLVLAAAAVAVGWSLLRPATLSASPLDLRVPTTGPVAVASGAAGPRAFVTADGQVLVVDLATRRIVGPLPGDGPGMALAGSITDLATSSDGASVYVSVDGSVIPYDAATLAHGLPTRLPDGAGHIAVAGSGADALLYVPSARTVGTVRPGAFSYGYTGSSAPPIAVAVDPSSQDTYVLSRAASGLQIERIDTGADRNAKPVGVPPEASGLAVTSDGTIWTATGDGLLAISTKDLTKRHLVPLPTTAGVRTLSAVGADLFVLTDDGRVILVQDDAVETSTSVVAPTVPGALAVGPEADCGVVVRPGSATVDIVDESSRCSG